tara:strand:- start:277 stop:447 length:171 start_codon:yes stop_codon:yes gene_type:complete
MGTRTWWVGEEGRWRAKIFESIEEAICEIVGTDPKGEPKGERKGEDDSKGRVRGES